MSQLSRVVVVLNPNSTGDGPTNARRLHDELEGTVEVELLETEYAGHAEEIAREQVMEDADTLVVSASGDGGYHEVVNGIVPTGRGLAAVLPSGNANDHASAVQERPLAQAIRDVVQGGRPTRIDLLQVQGSGRTRLAHSYVGVGITPVAAAALNEHDLDAVKEALLVMKAFWGYRPLTITHDGRDISLDSLVFANIDRMAKYAQLAPDSEPDDGRFETLLIPHRSKFRLLADFTRVLRGAHPVESRETPYEFRTHTPMPLQLDGEVFHVDEGTSVTVSCLPLALRTVV